MPPADDRLTVAMVQILRCIHLFTKQGPWFTVGALVALFQDHLALGFDVPSRKANVDHPVAFHLHHQVQTIRCD
eukprot:CAMPEP_0195275080 /NCGR_PEP_ID=MMETSP0706-20130129/17599_1 /TAXON_ID=33640 /ORGANISM="Asterionellopsis glacialis, Strain CCMP134" /LENGTH=73 /DNA_ID=CAMNT_0040332207 /DNA_START=297 /DNA_END=515 /DNA_ORIENTATION=-